MERKRKRFHSGPRHVEMQKCRLQGSRPAPSRAGPRQSHSSKADPLPSVNKSIDFSSFSIFDRQPIPTKTQRRCRENQPAVRKTWRSFLSGDMSMSRCPPISSIRAQPVAALGFFFSFDAPLPFVVWRSCRAEAQLLRDSRLGSAKPQFACLCATSVRNRLT